jgi:hypothetical protein
MLTCIIVETDLQFKAMISRLGTTQSQILFLSRTLNSSDITGRDCFYLGLFTITEHIHVHFPFFFRF